MKNVLFVCVGNSARSQMAEALFNHFAQGRAIAVSAGTEPAAAIAPEALEALREIGLDLQNQSPKAITEEMVQAADMIISMGCGVEESCPVYLGMKIDEDWELEDPHGQPVERLREIRDAISQKVKHLLPRLLA